MKTTKSLSLLLIICIALACCACSGKKEEETPDHELTPPEISELAMNNFVKKLETGNYTVTGGNRVTVNAGSPEQVFFEYEKEFDPFCYAFMTATGSTDYRLGRIAGWLDPEAFSSGDAYQQTMSKMTIGSGGISGIGMFRNGAISQLNYVPADWTDFIYSTIGETWGFIGCVSVLAGYILILCRMLYLAWYTRDKFGRLIICGVMGMLLFHVLENIAMTLGLMPITGIPLPFLSYGGSNMMTNMGGVGLVLNVTRNRSISIPVNAPQTLHNPYRIKIRYKTR